MLPRRGLIIMNAQRDLVDEDGALALPRAAAAVSVITALRKLGDVFSTTVFVCNYHPPSHVSFLTGEASSSTGSQPAGQRGSRTSGTMKGLSGGGGGGAAAWPPHCIQGTKGAEIAPALFDVPQCAWHANITTPIHSMSGAARTTTHESSSLPAEPGDVEGEGFGGGQESMTTGSPKAITAVGQRETPRVYACLCARDVVVYKKTRHDFDSDSAFEDGGGTKTYLRDVLVGDSISELYIVGFMSEHDVVATALAAQSLGYAVTVVEDGCQAFNAREGVQAMFLLQESGVRVASFKELSFAEGTSA